ncbi:MAG TPA: ParB/RepB/Spo0J family partition protein [Alphaproteobacteria bacterium]|nr:ParB/RepB/Spo0J family partition protein [Alphaproteobacteria bacterium]
MNPPPKQLGRGLSALLGEAAGEATSSAAARATKLIPVASIRPGTFQPRRNFTKDEMDELVASVRQQGVLQPVLLRKDPRNPQGYELIAGERRWRAAQLAQLHEIPAVVRELNDRQSLEAALVENLQRSDLSDIEEARAYRRLMDDFGHTQEKIAEALGKSRPYVANAIRLLELPERVQQMIETGAITAGHGRLLVGAHNAAELAAQWADSHITVREAEAVMRGTKPAKVKLRGAKKHGKAGGEVLRDANTLDLERRVATALGMKVSILHKKGAPSGVFQIFYQSLDQLDDILERLNR